MSYKLYNMRRQEMGRDDTEDAKTTLGNAYRAQYDSIGEVLPRIMNEQKAWSQIKGMRVLIKPNILSGLVPERHVTTHPSIVRSIVAYCREAGAKKIYVGDISGDNLHSRSNVQAAVKAGIVDAADGSFVDLANQEMTTVHIEGHQIGSLQVSRLARDVDLIINAPKLKTHCRTFLTGPIKNLFGLVPNHERQRIHAEASSIRAFAAVLIEIWEHFLPAITVMDAIVAMEGNGPVSDQLRCLNTLIFAKDALYAERIAARLLGINEADLPILACARSRRSCNPAVEAQLPSLPFELSDFKMPITFRRLGWDTTALPKFKGYSLGLRLNIRECVACGICVARCPMGAIILDEYPKMDLSKCIGCLCCHELCPSRAWLLPEEVESE